jgi:dihydrofolate synthase/folylpolyglutamate synthase
MLSNKDLHGFLEPFAGSGAHIHAVPVAGHEHHDATALTAAAIAVGLTAEAAPDATAALTAIAADATVPPLVLIGGSLYLAGTILAANGTPPV